MPIPRPTSDNYEYPSDAGIMGEDYQHDQSRFKEVTDKELKAFQKKKSRQYRNEKGEDLSVCCDAFLTYHDTTLCCKKCWNEVVERSDDDNP